MLNRAFPARGNARGILGAALALAIAFVMALSVGVAFGLRSHTAQAADGRPTLPFHTSVGVRDGKLEWARVPGIEAQWNDAAKTDGRYLNAESAYWTDSNDYDKVTDNLSVNRNNKKGARFNVLGESYDFTPDMQSYRTRAVLAFEQTSDTAPWTKVSETQFAFAEAVVGRIGGAFAGDNAPMSVLMWDSNPTLSANMLSKDVIDCGNDGYGLVFRVDDGSSDVLAACSPLRVKKGGGDSIVIPQKNGGQMDPRTGFVYYTTDRVGYLDQYGPAQKINANGKSVTPANYNAGEANSQIVVWDPLTGDYVLSKEVQPNGAAQRNYLAMTNAVWDSGNRELYNGTNAANFVNNGNSYMMDLRPSKGLFLDAYGNAYLQVGTSSSVDDQGNSTARNPKFDMTLLRVTPYRDANGNFLDPTTVTNGATPLDGVVDSSWTYDVVTKFDPAPSSTDLRFPNGARRSVGLVNGNLVSIGYNTPSGNNSYAQMLAFNPFTSAYRSVSSVENGTTLESSNLTNVCPNRNGCATDYVERTPGTNMATWSVDYFVVSSITSASVMGIVTGNVYWNKNGDGVPNPDRDDADNPRLEGQQVGLYDDSGALLATATTGRLGTYTMFATPARNATSTYTVRLVQPQVPIDTDNDRLTRNHLVTMVRDDAGNEFHSATVLNVDAQGNATGARRTDRMDAEIGIRNAAQSWARTSHESIMDNDSTADGATETAACVDGAATASATGAPCYGAVRAPYVDKALTRIGDPSGYGGNDQMPIHTTVTLPQRNHLMWYMAHIDFAVTAAGSYGDTGEGFNSLNANHGPFLVSPDQSVLHTGALKGVLTDGGQDNPVATESHSAEHWLSSYTEWTSNDGLLKVDHVVTGNGGGGRDHETLEPVWNRDDSADHGFVRNAQGEVIARKAAPIRLSKGERYRFTVQVGGTEGTSGAYAVYDHAMHTSTQSDGRRSGMESTELKGAGTADAGTEYTFDLTVSNASEIGDGNNIIGKIRIIAAPSEAADNNTVRYNGGETKALPVDNTNGDYNGPAFASEESNSRPWTYPGEIEDYWYMIVAPQFRLPFVGGTSHDTRNVAAVCVLVLSTAITVAIVLRRSRFGGPRR